MMHVDWLLGLKALLCGVVTGALFTLLKLPAPVPQALEGTLGIIGLWLGFFLVIIIRAL